MSADTIGMFVVAVVILCGFAFIAFMAWLGQRG